MFSSEKLKNMIFITLVFCIWTCSCMLHFSILSLCKYQCSISPIKNICSYQFLDDSASSAKNPFTFQTVSETKPRKTLIKTARGMPKKPIFADILNLNPIIDMKHEWKNELEYWVLGTVFKTVQQGANKCLTNVAFIEIMALGLTWLESTTTIWKNLVINFVNCLLHRKFAWIATTFWMFKNLL